MLSDEGKHVTQEEAAYARAKAEKVYSVFMGPPWAAAERGRESTKPQGPGKEGLHLVFGLCPDRCGGDIW